jgi:4a-hydroxytetrahydrobiopterin dehydratase
MSELSRLKCVACRGGEPTVTPEELREYLPQIPEWRVIEVDGVQRLERQFRFKDFAQALAFVNRVGAAAEEEDHHPRIVLEWGRVGVQWWTHVIKGLHRNDFIMAARTDETFEST